jgi:hypothetical protein
MKSPKLQSTAEVNRIAISGMRSSAPVAAHTNTAARAKELRGGERTARL